jgi:hypothetical protein
VFGTVYKLRALAGGVWLRICLALAMTWGAAGCASLISTATSGMADNLSAAILNQDDPETVRDGAPAYLLMMDSFVEGSPKNSSMLSAAAELYAAYGIIFVDDDDRARRLTNRSLKYARQAMCVEDKGACGLWAQPYEAFEAGLAELDERGAATLFTVGLSWLAYIQAHSDDWSALADLPKAEATLLRVRALDSTLRAADLEHFLAVLNTLRPPALGGQFDKGRSHYERAIELTNGHDLGIKVDFARFYARTLYDRELHDRLLTEVLESDPVQPGLTLFNTLAQRDARAMLDSADDYF